MATHTTPEGKRVLPLYLEGRNILNSKTLTRVAMGTLREACKRFRFVGAFAFEPERHRFSAQLRENGVSAGPDRVQHDAEPQESHNGQLIVDMMRNYNSALSSW